MRKRKFDFIIDKWEGFDKKVLRFYPRQSNVHGFDDEPPTTWKGVYKTYMTFAVLHYYEDDDNEGKYERPYELFSYYRDEGGRIEIFKRGFIRNDNRRMSKRI